MVESGKGKEFFQKFKFFYHWAAFGLRYDFTSLPLSQRTTKSLGQRNWISSSSKCTSLWCIEKNAAKLLFKFEFFKFFVLFRHCSNSTIPMVLFTWCVQNLKGKPKKIVQRSKECSGELTAQNSGTSICFQFQNARGFHLPFWAVSVCNLSKRFQMAFFRVLFFQASKTNLTITFFTKYRLFGCAYHYLSFTKFAFKLLIGAVLNKFVASALAEHLWPMFFLYQMFLVSRWLSASHLLNLQKNTSVRYHRCYVGPK